jgi:hypothetical protein
MKFENNKFKRGLDEGEEPFPVSPKIGPYIVEKPVFGAWFKAPPSNKNDSSLLFWQLFG